MGSVDDAQPDEVAQVVDVEAPRHLALALRALAEDVAHLADPADLAAADDLDEDLVAERAHDPARDGAPPHHEVAAHRIAHAAEHAGQQREPEELRAAGDDAPVQAPSRSRRRPRRGGSPRPGRRRAPSPSTAPASTSGGCWRSASMTASTSPRAACQPRITAVASPRSPCRRITRSLGWSARSSRGDLPGPVGAVVVHDDQLVRAPERALEQARQPLDQLAHVPALVEGRDHEREPNHCTFGCRRNRVLRRAGAPRARGSLRRPVGLPWSPCQYSISGG